MKTTTHEAFSRCGGSHHTTAPASERTVEASNDGVLDVRQLIPARRHTLIFQTFNNLGKGQSFVLVNDHNPKPLYYQFAAEHSGEFSWNYDEQGPEVWRERIGKI